MSRLRNWVSEKIKSNQLDLNSDMAEAVGYLANQWTKLTEFLRTPGVPLDTNLVEQTIKIVIRYRKNSRAYKNQVGAEVGDRMMSLGQTVISNGKSPYNYFLWCLNNRKDLKTNPEQYTPFKYLQTNLNTS